MQEKLDSLNEDLAKVSSQLEHLMQLRFKLLGAIEVLEAMKSESVEAEVVKKDKK